MYERMLNKDVMPTFHEMTVYCGQVDKFFVQLNTWLSQTYHTEQTIVFPYGHKYGWGVAHRQKRKLLCHIFAENNAFTVMVRLTNQQFESIYTDVQQYTQKYIDHRYPCGDGGWIHYRVTSKEHFDDIIKIFIKKCEKK